jgi:hypothetical protein
MKFTNWYRNGDLEAFCKFCMQNRGKLISIHLTQSEIVKGILYDHLFRPFEAAGVFILLTTVAIHPAFFDICDIDSLHYLASAALIQTSSVIPSKMSLIQDGLTYML